MSYSLPRGDELYHERLRFRLMDFIVALEMLLALGFLVMFFYQVYVGPIGNDPAPGWFYLLMVVLMLVVVWLLASMRYLDISLTPQSISVGYGLFRKSVPWQRVTSIKEVERPGWSYGGYGIRLGPTRGGWFLVYNVINRPTLSVELMGGHLRWLVFSTRHPEEIVALAESQIKSHEHV